MRASQKFLISSRQLRLQTFWKHNKAGCKALTYLSNEMSQKQIDFEILTKLKKKENYFVGPV